jgi:hypothetical protein
MYLQSSTTVVVECEEKNVEEEDNKVSEQHMDVAQNDDDKLQVC